MRAHSAALHTLIRFTSFSTFPRLGEGLRKQSALHCREAYALEHLAGLFGLQVSQELLGGIGVGSSLQHGGRVNDLAAHLLGGLVHGGQIGAEGIGAVHDTGVTLASLTWVVTSLTLEP